MQTGQPAASRDARQSICLTIAHLTNTRYAAGAVYTRFGKAEVGSPLMEHSQEELADCEGLVVRVRGDGQVYCVVLTTGLCTMLRSASICQTGTQAQRICVTGWFLLLNSARQHPTGYFDAHRVLSCNTWLHTSIREPASAPTDFDVTPVAHDMLYRHWWKLHIQVSNQERLLQHQDAFQRF